MSAESITGTRVDTREICPVSGHRCDFFIEVNEAYTKVDDISEDIYPALSEEDQKSMLYDPSHHAAAIECARRIAIKNCVKIDKNCGLPQSH